MSRIMLDGINSDTAAMARYPGAFAFAAGYVDGLYAWSAADWARFPHAVHIRIAVFSTTDDGHVLDCEQGNATPAQSVDWVLARRKAGLDPTVYCGRNTWWSAIRAAFKARNVPEPHYWVADYSVDQADPQIPAGAIGLQYHDAGPYDLSVVADYWPGVDPAPAAQPTAPSGGPVYLISVSPDPTGSKGAGIFAVHEGLGPVHVDGATYTAEFKANHGLATTVSPAYYAALVAAATPRPVTVNLDSAAVAAELAKLAPSADAIAAALPAHLDITVTAK